MVNRARIASHVIYDKFDSWLHKELNFPRPKDSENMTALSYQSSNLSLIALKTMRLVVLNNNDIMRSSQN